MLNVDTCLMWLWLHNRINVVTILKYINGYVLLRIRGKLYWYTYLVMQWNQYSWLCILYKLLTRWSYILYQICMMRPLFQSWLCSQQLIHEITQIINKYYVNINICSMDFVEMYNLYTIPSMSNSTRVIYDLTDRITMIFHLYIFM